MNRSIGLAVGALVIAVIALWWWSTSGAPSAAPAPAADPETALPPVQPEVALEPAPAAAPPAAAPLAQAPEPDEEPQPEAEPELPPAAPMVAPHTPTPPTGPVGPIAQLKAAFDRDPVDAQAADVERDLRARFAMSEVPKDMVHSIICHQRSCRVELTWVPEKPLGYMAAAMLLNLHLNPMQGVQPRGEPAPDGSRTLELFVARKGLSAADFDPAPAAR